MLPPAAKRAVNIFLKEIPKAYNGKRLSISGARSMSGIPKHKLEINAALHEQKINVKGVDINYLKAGRGSHPVLLLPGALGSIWTDFKPQIENLDKDKFSLIVWDPPGSGKSRPPNRTYNLDCFARDANVAKDFMQAIGHDKYSLIGWSDGGRASFFFAAKYPESVEKMIVIGTNARVVLDELTTYKSMRNIDTWSEGMRAPLVSFYGEEYVRRTWAAWVDAMEEFYVKQNGNICIDLLRHIKCPTLICHGAKDVLVRKDQPKFLAENIKNSKVHIFDNGAHNLHLKFHEEFNKLATEFLMGN